MMDADPTRNDIPAPPEPALEWVPELLRSEWPESPEFQIDVNSAVLRSRHVARLRHQVERAGEWVPRPAPDYLRALAAAARVPLDWVIGWAGLPPDLLPVLCLPPAGAGCAGNWGWNIARRPCPIGLAFAPRLGLIRRCCWLAPVLTLQPGRLRSTTGRLRWLNPFPYAGRGLWSRSSPPRMQSAWLMMPASPRKPSHENPDAPGGVGVPWLLKQLAKLERGKRADLVLRLSKPWPARSALKPVPKRTRSVSAWIYRESISVAWASG